MLENSCSGNARKLTWGSSFCNDGGCKTRISSQLGSTREIFLKGISCKSQPVEVIDKGKPFWTFSLACNLLKIL